MTGFAASPGTAVLPKCSMRRMRPAGTHECKVLGLLLEQMWPAWIVKHNGDLLLDSPPHSFSHAGHLTAVLTCSTGHPHATGAILEAAIHHGKTYNRSQYLHAKPVRHCVQIIRSPATTKTAIKRKMPQIKTR